jgi:hypothetical protein
MGVWGVTEQPTDIRRFPSKCKILLPSKTIWQQDFATVSALLGGLHVDNAQTIVCALRAALDDLFTGSERRGAFLMSVGCTVDPRTP